MILSGEKKEEYRDIKKFYHSRFINVDPVTYEGEYKEFDTVTFTNGYRPDSPRFEIEFKGIGVGLGLSKWGAEPGKKYFVIKLGEVLTNG